METRIASTSRWDGRDGSALELRIYLSSYPPGAVQSTEKQAADDTGRLLSGSAPLRVRVIDPLGGVRYDLYRATDRGTLTLSLPQGLNDPAGKWTVKVSKLLDAGGAVRAACALPQDVTAMGWAGPRLIVGDADGRVVALTGK
jgi:hypothetical protein